MPLSIEQQLTLTMESRLFQQMSNEDKLLRFQYVLEAYMTMHNAVKDLYKEKLIGSESFIP
jgi:hypothetical protein